MHYWRTGDKCYIYRSYKESGTFSIVSFPLASFTNVRKQLGATIKLNKATVEVVGMFSLGEHAYSGL